MTPQLKPQHKPYYFTKQGLRLVIRNQSCTPFARVQRNEVAYIFPGYNPELIANWQKNWRRFGVRLYVIKSPSQTGGTSKSQLAQATFRALIVPCDQLKSLDSDIEAALKEATARPK